MNKPKEKILVLKGGFSDEKTISLKTAKNVERAIKDLGYDFDSIDCKDNFIDKISNSDFDLCFNALHGKFGEDGQIQALLEKIGIKYTHSGVSSSILSMNKALAKEIFIKNDIPTPDYVITDVNEITNNDIPIPSVIKPTDNGSSLGVYIIFNESDKINIIKVLKNWKFGNHVMIENYINGRELTCGVINNKPTEIMEIISSNLFYDYETKYTKGKSNYEHVTDLSTDVYKKIQELALKCHMSLGCKGVTRTDFRLNKNKIPYVLETNTNPGLTKTSLVPKLAALQGISYNKLIDIIIKDGLCQN